MIWKCRSLIYDLSRRGEVLGILNVTPDSFSDGGRYSQQEAAVAHGETMISEGAAIIDIGGESTRPGASEVDADEEMKRILPVVKVLSERHPDIALSIDTSKPVVAEAAIRAGASIINDVTGFQNPLMIRVAAQSGVGVICMHMQGTPRNMQQNPIYRDLIGEVRNFFGERFEAMTSGGIEADAIVWDPGIGFGKTVEHNLELIRRMDELRVWDRPLLLGVSRKSFIGKIIGSDQVNHRSWATVGITASAAERGVPLHRVHEVRGNLEALRMMEAILQGVD